MLQYCTKKNFQLPNLKIIQEKIAHTKNGPSYIPKVLMLINFFWNDENNFPQGGHYMPMH
jgi:hypothetical protein